jgi:beta-phosphoglucomutase
MIREMHAANFDLDGVIVDSAKYHYLAWKRLAHEHGFAFAETDNERLKGVSRTRSLEIPLEIGGLNVDASAKEKWQFKKMDGVSTTFKAWMHLKSCLARPNICKAFGRRESKLCLGQHPKMLLVSSIPLGISALFDVIVDGNEVSKAKPDPGVFLRAASELNIPPTSCVVFEDAEAAIQAALHANMGVVGIGKPALLKNADMVIGALSQLVVLTF